MRCDPHASRTRTIDLVERAAVGASLLCLVHCAGLPLLLAALPALSRMVAIPEALHLWLLAFGLFDVFVLLWPGDILHIYALAALFLFPFRTLGPKTLVALGLGWA
ncbi:MerC family mercury resistance protein, partial [Proteus mirabilis]|uniref:MerC family mercury resistance protein n=1 Tax=Proteus mirabilis TaxID=584 RepID=UPI0013D74143